MTAAEQVSLFAPEPSKTLDCRGMQCPAPILELSKAARTMGKQPAVLEIIVDDADFPQDLKAWCRASKNQLIHIAEQDGIFVAHIGVNIADERTPTSGSRLKEAASTVRPPAVEKPEPIATVSPAGFSNIVPREAVDCRGMQCPAPILAIAKKAQLFRKQPAFLDITATDSDFPTDLKAWCKSAKATLVALEQNAGYYEALVALNGAERATPSEGVQAAVPPASQEVPQSTVAAPNASMADSSEEAATVDLRGLPATAPVAHLSKLLASTRAGTVVTVLADQPSFVTDCMTWALASRVEVLSLNRNGTTTVADLRFTGQPIVTGFGPLSDTGASSSANLAQPLAAVHSRSTSLALAAGQTALSSNSDAEADVTPRENLCSILIIKNDFESLMAAMMVATTSAAQGMEVNVFFSFWGVNLLRGEKPRRDVPKEKVSLLQKMMQWMMPRGPQRQKMSKMHMGGMGKGMMQYFMRKNNVLTLQELMGVAVEQNVTFTVCSMSMGIMGIQKRDIVDLPNVQYAGVTSFVETSRRASMSLVF